MAAIAVFMMMAVACAPVFAVIAEDKGTSAAPADVSAITDVEMQLFTETDKDLSGLLYQNSKLPKGVDSTAWVKINTLFMNVDKNDTANYGKFLTYGTAGVTDRATILADYANYLPMIQVVYTYSEPIAAGKLMLKITHAGMAGPGVTPMDIGPTFMDKTTIGAHFDKVQGMVNYSLTVGSANVGFCPTSNANIPDDYDVSISANGATVSEKTLVCGQKDIALTGGITDANATAVNGATVNYTVNGTAMSTKCLANAYTIKAQPGSVVVITGIIATGYTFKEVTPGVLWNFGNISAAATKEFKANESTVVITVTDAGSTPVVGASLTAQWYSTTIATPTIAAESGTANVIGTTNADGKVSIAYITPVDTTKTFTLVIKATGAPSYTFKTLDVKQGLISATVKPISEQITITTAPGMYLMTSATGTLKAVETAYKVSGTITGLNGKIATVSYTNGIGTSVLCKADGTYSFNVIKNSSPVITVTCAGYTFAPVSVTVPTVTATVTVNFAATTIPSITYVTPTPLGTFTTGDVTAGTVVTFEYTVGAKTYKTDILAKSPVSLTVNGAPGSTVSSITATAPGYVGNLLNGTNVEKTIFTYNAIKDSKGTVVAEQPVSVSINYTYTADGKTVTGTVKTDANGVGKLTLPTSIIKDIAKDVTFYSGVYVLKATNGVLGTTTAACTIDASKAYNAPAGKYTVNVDHVSTYAQSNPAVPYVPTIGSGDVLMNVGDKVSLYAPEYNGYTFKCWMLNGTSIGTDRTIDFTLTQKVLDASDKTAGQDEVYLQAVYSATPVFAPSAGIDNMTLIIGIIAVVIALLAVVYTVISLKKE